MTHLFSRFLIFISLTVVIWAYSPTINSHYATQDQWRAFRYSVPEATPSYRLQSCFDMIPSFYVLTGRPLVWPSECLEHATVSRIDDFAYFRPFILMIVLLTIVYIGSLMRSLIGGLEMGVIALSLFIFSPGYSFMYLQGMTGATVLLGLILAGISFSLLNRWIDQEQEASQVIKLWKPSFFFIAACMIYPSGAFIVITMALLRFGFDANTNIFKRLVNLAKTIGFYFTSSIIYYLLIKIMIFLYAGPTPNQNSDGRQFIIQFDLPTLWGRINDLLTYLYNTPFLNFQMPKGATFIVLAVFSIKIGFEIYKANRKSFWMFIFGSIAIFCLSLLILIASLSPWLFSHMDIFVTRYFMPVYFFFSATIVGLIWNLAKNSSIAKKNFVPGILIVLLVMPVALLQKKNSSLEVEVFKSEITMLRSAVGEWLDNKGYINNKYLLAVIPEEERPAFIGINDVAGLGENAVLASAPNPVSIPWMITAVLRERDDHPIGKTVGVVDCSFDPNCAEYFLAQGQVVYGVTTGNTPIRTQHHPFIINFSLLTSKKVYPNIELVH